MADDKLKEEERVELVEKPDPGHDDAHAKITIDDDAALLAGKVSFAQKVVGDRFEVLDIVGQGGMGSVYKVRDSNTDRIVALKLLKPELCEDKAVLKRFLQEAASLSELDHENIVCVYDHGITDDGAPFLIMQYLDGETVADLIARNGKLNPTQAIDLTLQICAGLDYAHKKGFIHRDIKPSNIVLLNDGTNLQVKLLDFGIAKIVETKSAATTNLTQTGDVFGTPAYMSPEQCQGGDIDKRTDIYSLGCVLYEMLTGKQPFAGSNAIQVALKHINGTPDSFTQNLPDSDILHSLEEIVLKCMRKAPKERFDSVAALLPDLNSVKTGNAVNYAAPDGAKVELKGIPRPIIRIGQFIGNFLFFWSAISVYIVTLFEIYVSDPAAGYIDRSEVISSLLLLVLLGLAIHAKGAVTAIKQRVKRRTLFGWTKALLAVLMFGSYGLLALVEFVPPSELGGNILSMTLVIWTVITWGVIATTPITCIFDIITSLATRLVLWWMNKRNSTLNLTYSKGYTISFSKALSRISPILGTVIVAYVALNPNAVSSVLSTGVYNLVTITGSNLAIPVLNFSNALDSQNVHAYKALAYQFDQDGEPEMKLQTLNRGLKVAPGNPGLLVDRGETYLADGQYKNAIADFEKIANKEVEARIGLGKAYLGTTEYEKSYRTFSRAISESANADDSLSEAYSGRALASYAQGKLAAAIDDFSKSIEEGNESDKTLNYVRRGLAYQAIGERGAARHDFETANRYYYRGEPSGEASLLEAFCEIQLGNKAAADAAMSEAMAENFTKDDLKGIIFPNLPSTKLEW